MSSKFSGFFCSAAGKADELNIDIIPLFETVDDLKNAAEIMRELYEIPAYRAHLESEKTSRQLCSALATARKTAVI